MSDLIDRRAAIAEFSCCQLTPDGGIDANYAIDFLKQLPSAQRTGRWIENSGNIACSECHIIWLHRRTAFCPNCGARMEETDERT